MQKTYEIIYADPPWHYAARKTGTAVYDPVKHNRGFKP